ncbi:MAG: hypothetical protein ACYDHY_12825 [Acidiferrobacterales bacterium]
MQILKSLIAFSRRGWALVTTFALGMAAAAPGLLWSATAVAMDINQASRNVGNEMAGVAYMVHMGAMLVGLVLFVMGLVKIAHSHKNKEPLMASIIMLVIGTALMGITAVIDMSSQSTIGGSAATSGASQLGLGN